MRQSIDYKKEKARRDFKFKKEKSEIEHNLRESMQQRNLTNYLLAAIFLVLLGIFIKLVTMNF